MDTNLKWPFKKKNSEIKFGCFRKFLGQLDITLDDNYISCVVTFHFSLYMFQSKMDEEYRKDET